MKNILIHPERSLAAKLIIAVGLSLIVVTSLFWFATLYKQKRDIHSIAVGAGKSFMEFIKRRTRHDMLTFDRKEIQTTIEDISIAEGVEKVRIFDHKGYIHHSTDRTDIGTPVNKASISCNSCHLDMNTPSAIASEPKKWEIYRSPKGFTALRLIDPVYNEKSCYTSQCHAHKKNEKILGFIEADMSLAILDKAQFRQMLALTGFVIIFFLVISLLLGIILYRIVSKPINELATGMKRVSEGDLDYRVSIKNKDEIGMLSDVFHLMTMDLKRAKERLEKWSKSLEEEVAKKTEEIRKTQEGLLQTEKLASLGRMAAGVAHELNSPLTGIVTFAHLMLQRIPPENKMDREDIEVIIEQAERCSKIIKGLLGFSRALPAAKADIGVNDIIMHVIGMVKNQAKFHNIKISTELAPELPPIRGDASQLQQVYMNLLINAADAMNDRGEIRIATRLIKEDETEYIEIEFTDNGPGIPEEYMNRLFEPFFTTKPAGKGTGLGLSVSHGIVRKHGGHILVKSKVGEGTTFLIRLPVKEESVGYSRDIL